MDQLCSVVNVSEQTAQALIDGGFDAGSLLDDGIETEQELNDHLQIVKETAGVLPADFSKIQRSLKRKYAHLLKPAQAPPQPQAGAFFSPAPGLSQATLPVLQSVGAPSTISSVPTSQAINMAIAPPQFQPQVQVVQSMAPGMCHIHSSAS
jgi:hypothetical protein